MYGSGSSVIYTTVWFFCGNGISGWMLIVIQVLQCVVRLGLINVRYYGEIDVKYAENKSSLHL